MRKTSIPGFYTIAEQLHGYPYPVSSPAAMELFVSQAGGIGGQAPIYFIPMDVKALPMWRYSRFRLIIAAVK